MNIILIKKLNVVREIDERDISEWEEKGYKKIGNTSKAKGEDLFAPEFEQMSDEELQRYADENGKDISKAKDRTAAIKILQK